MGREFQVRGLAGMVVHGLTGKTSLDVRDLDICPLLESCKGCKDIQTFHKNML